MFDEKNRNNKIESSDDTIASSENSAAGTDAENDEGQSKITESWLIFFYWVGSFG